MLLGVTIVTPIRNNPGHFQSAHANVLGRVIPNGLPTGNKAEMRPSEDLTNEMQHVGTCKVSLERAERKSTVDCPDPVWSFLIIIIIYSDSRKTRFSCINPDTQHLRS